MQTHELKTWPDSFCALLDKRKRYEVRCNDRGFQVGDRLRLREWDPATATYSGREYIVQVTYMTHGGEWGLPSDLCVLSIAHGHEVGLCVCGKRAPVRKYSYWWAEDDAERFVAPLCDVHYCAEHTGELLKHVKKHTAERGE